MAIAFAVIEYVVCTCIAPGEYSGWGVEWYKQAEIQDGVLRFVQMTNSRRPKTFKLLFCCMTLDGSFGV